MKKYYIKTFGCQMNVSDSEMVAGWYEKKGWKPAKKVEEADEIVIVTCSVRQTAEDRVYGFVNNLKTRKSIVIPAKAGIYKNKFKIIVTGCMLRYTFRFLKEKMPQVDEFRKISEYKDHSQLTIRNSDVHAYIPIMEGCNNFCSYCVVPYARGREVSRPLEEIVCEVKELAERGYKEITLLGQNVNSYQGSLNTPKFPKTPFAALLTRLHYIKGIEKISFLTSNPWDLNDDIIQAMSLPKIDRYLHLAVQSGDDEILKKMNRKYTANQFISLVEKIKKAVPDIQIGTDIIVGFSGETEDQFQNTINICKKIGFVKAYVSMYSPRPQTNAFKMKDDISHKEKRRRWKILDDLINK